MELLSGRFDEDEVAAIYFGGGTTNLYRPRQYAELTGLVRKAFPHAAPDVEVTVEGVAQFFTQEKLEAMRDAGVNRVSMGIQQLNPDLLGLSGRKQDTAHVIRMLEACQELNFASSVDLIFGWPGQSPQSMLQDLEAMTRLRVPHITHYELNLAGRSDFSRRQRHPLPPVAQVVEMYRLSPTI
jgi:oxygen-independent coproporphyrinogen-3 oxidase